MSLYSRLTDVPATHEEIEIVFFKPYKHVLLSMDFTAY